VNRRQFGGKAPHGVRARCPHDAPEEFAVTLRDEDMVTTPTMTVPGGDADGTDGAGGDADGTDGAGAGGGGGGGDGTDKAGGDADGTDKAGGDADGTDSGS
jgi:hypothetical protein